MGVQSILPRPMSIIHGATTVLTVMFPPETCSFYDLMRGNNDILASWKG